MVFPFVSQLITKNSRFLSWAQIIIEMSTRSILSAFLFFFFSCFPQLALKDPVHTVSLQQFVYEKLKAQQELLGEQGFHALMETVDTEVVAQLQEFLQGF